MILYTIGLGCRRGSSAAAIAAAVRAALGERWLATLLPHAVEVDAFDGMGAAVPDASRTVPSRHGNADPRGGVQVATLDAKAAEPGLLDYCTDHRLPLRLFPRAALAQASANAGAAPGLPVSQPCGAARARFGLDGVCEPAALCASPGGVLLVRKTSLHGVSIALAGPAATRPAVDDSGPFTHDRR